MGFSLLIIDLRCCGKSEGNWYTFGYYEHEDLNQWVKYVHKNYKNSKIVLGGVSLGGTISLMVPNINKHVDAIIDDCGFVNAYKQLEYTLDAFFHLPGKIFMPMVNVYYKWFLKVNLRWVDTIESLKNTRVPILFIHGIDDQFILIDNTINNYNSYKGKKEKLFVNYASHGMSYLYDRKAYTEAIKKFIKKHGI
jgi:alpha/beta superfamily hydrolase